VILSGLNDPVIPQSGAGKLNHALAAAAAQVERIEPPAGHGLTPADVARTKGFFSSEVARGSVRRLEGLRTRLDPIARRQIVFATNLTIWVMTVEDA
jgi:hypothetical protein